MNRLELCKANLELLILSTAQTILPQLELVITVPGIQSYSTIGIISEVGVDMSVFPSSEHFCSRTGLTPQNNESVGKKKITRISRAGVCTKPLLVQCVLTVCKSSKHPEIRNRYLSLKKRRRHKKAIIAIARMLLTAIYNILKKNEPYNPELCLRCNNTPPEHRAVSVEGHLYFATSGLSRYPQYPWTGSVTIFWLSQGGLGLCAFSGWCQNNNIQAYPLCVSCIIHHVAKV